MENLGTRKVTILVDFLGHASRLNS